MAAPHRSLAAGSWAEEMEGGHHVSDIENSPEVLMEENEKLRLELRYMRAKMAATAHRRPMMEAKRGSIQSAFMADGGDVQSIAIADSVQTTGVQSESMIGKVVSCDQDLQELSSLQQEPVSFIQDLRLLHQEHQDPSVLEQESGSLVQERRFPPQESGSCTQDLRLQQHGYVGKDMAVHASSPGGNMSPSPSSSHGGSRNNIGDQIRVGSDDAHTILVDGAKPNSGIKGARPSLPLPKEIDGATVMVKGGANPKYIYVKGGATKLQEMNQSTRVGQPPHPTFTESRTDGVLVGTTAGVPGAGPNHGRGSFVSGFHGGPDFPEHGSSLSKAPRGERMVGESSSVAHHGRGSSVAGSNGGPATSVRSAEQVAMTSRPSNPYTDKMKGPMAGDRPAANPGSSNGESSIPKSTGIPTAAGNSWASLLKPKNVGNFQLHYVEDNAEVDVVRVPRSVAQIGCPFWENSIFGYFLDKKLPYSLVKEGAQKHWGKAGLIDFLAMENGFYIFKFASTTEMEAVLEGGPWYFGGKPIFIQKWYANMKMFKERVTKVPIWIKLFNVPLELWTEEG